MPITLKKRGSAFIDKREESIKRKKGPYMNCMSKRGSLLRPTGGFSDSKRTGKLSKIGEHMGAWGTVLRTHKILKGKKGLQGGLRHP